MTNPNDAAYAAVCEGWGQDGLTKRELFAAMALQGLLSYSYCNPSRGNYIENCSACCAAKDAVSYADALIAALNKPLTPEAAQPENTNDNP